MADLFEQGEIYNHQLQGDAAAAGAMSVAVSPGTGQMWEILYVDVFHDDAAGPSGQWRMSNGVTVVQIGDGAALVASTREALYRGTLPHCLYLHEGTSLGYYVDVGATNGAKATMSLITRRIVGLL